MKKNYLLKPNKKIFTTTKKVIVVNMDDFWSTIDYINIRYYRYKENILNKNPKELIIRGNKFVSLPHHTYLYKFPVEKVIFDCDEYHLYHENLQNFNNTKELEISKNVKNIKLISSYGLKNVENIIISFNIKKLNYHSILNYKIKTITIKHEDKEEIIELDNIFMNREIDISISNTNNILNIDIESKYSKVNYKVYIENNEIKHDKKYSKYEIIPNDNDLILDLVNLRKNIDAIFTSSEILNYETIIISKQDYDFLLNMKSKKDKLKEIIIKDDNEMSLLPRNINIDVNTYTEYFKKIEIINGDLLIVCETFQYGNIRYVIINKDLSMIKIDRKHFGYTCPIIEGLILDFNATKFSEINKDNNYLITIPFNKNTTINDYKGLTHLLNTSKNISIKSNGNEVIIPKYIYDNDFRISNIKRYNDDDFGVLYDEIIDGTVRKHNECIIYNYDEISNSYKAYNYWDGPYSKKEIEKEKIKRLTFIED